VTPDASRRPSHRVIAWAVLRVVASVAVVEALYYSLPFDHASTAGVVAILIIGLAIFMALIGLQVRAIVRSPFPVLRGVEALAVSVPLFLALFASSYFVMARLAAATFGTPLTRTDALYFTVTVFSTVGFGDITPKTQGARLVVTGQMIADLVILGIAIRIVIEAVKRGRSTASR
jgi:voltage-gated potassium channel